MKGGCPLSQRARGHNCTLLELNSAEQTIECRLWVGGNMRDFSVGNGRFGAVLWYLTAVLKVVAPSPVGRVRIIAPSPARGGGNM